MPDTVEGLHALFLFCRVPHERLQEMYNEVVKVSSNADQAHGSARSIRCVKPLHASGTLKLHALSGS